MKALIWGIVEIFIVSIIYYSVYFKHLIKKEPLLKSFVGVEDVVLKLLAGGILIYLTFAALIPAIQDIPNIIHKNIYIVEGVSQSYCPHSKLNSMSAYILDEVSQEKVYVTFTYKGTIEIGDRLIVQYLPNLKLGVLIEKNGEIIGKRIE